MSMIISCREDYDLGERLAETLGVEHSIASRKTFPDGEIYVRVPDKLPSTVAIVQTLYPDQNTRFLELLLAINAVKNQGVERIIAIVPYLAYSRQDKVFLKGEPISVRVVLEMIHNAGADILMTVEIHNSESLSWFKGVAVNIRPFQHIAEHLKNMPSGETIVVAPDIGAIWRAKSLASVLGTEYDYLVKHRDRITGEISIEPKSINVRDKHVVIVDDIISTGGTIAKASEALKKLGAASISVAAVHGLFVSNAIEKIKKAGVDRVIVTNTTTPPSNVEVVDITSLLATHLKQFITV